MPGVLPYFKQEADVYCGPAVVQMILAKHGIVRTQSELARAFGTTPTSLENPIHTVVGTRLSAIEAYLKENGFTVSYKNGATFADIEQGLQEGKDLIVGFIAPEDNLPHYSLVANLTDSHIILIDPAESPTYTLSRDDFSQRWVDDELQAFGDRALLTVENSVAKR